MIENLNPRVRDRIVGKGGGGRKMIGWEKKSPRSISHAGHEFVKELIRHHSQDRREVSEDSEEAAASFSAEERSTGCLEIEVDLFAGPKRR